MVEPVEPVVRAVEDRGFGSWRSYSEGEVEIRVEEVRMRRREACVRPQNAWK